ncbi:MAG: M43 family zinc metalloprotease [Bacteroidota bacterium]
MLQGPPNECNYLLQARKTFQVHVYITRDSLSTPITTVEQIQEAIDGLNEQFEPIDMTFTICEDEVLEDFHFFNWSQADDEEYALNYHYNPNVINMYFTNTVETIDEGVVGGYAFFPGGPRATVIGVDGDGTVPLTVLVHEMGHFFGLYHTFEVEFGVEDINQNNCDVAGDFICDTEADINGDVNDDCEYQGPFSDGTNFYTPPLDNWMSYYTSCACRFTIQQYNKMVENYLDTERFNLW